jgi:hypothetical protein
MTIDIKKLAKQSGALHYAAYGTGHTPFTDAQLTKFVRLVRESALDEVEKQFDPDNGAWPAISIIKTIRSLKK